ncbi:MAG: hypothetical protein AAFN74_14900 [Myxococcota bacterium]
MTGLIVATTLLVAAPTPIAVMAFEAAGGASPQMASQLTARAADLIARRPGTRVISPDDIRALILKEEQRQRLGCTDQACIAEIVGALGADRLVAGRVAKLADGWSVTMSMIDASTTTVLSRSNERWGGPSLELLPLLEPMVATLFSKAPETLAGAIELYGAEDDSTVLIDDEYRGRTPLPVLRAVPIGGRKLTVTHDDHFPFEQWVVVKPGLRRRVVIDQQAQPQAATYETWWFWTAVGAGVAGLAATAVVLSTNGGDGSATGVQVGVNVDDAIQGGR